MIDGNYRKKSITWFETTWIYFHAEIVQHWNAEKMFGKIFCKKTLIWCHVLEIDDDATNRLYMHVLSLSIWVYRTRSEAYSSVANQRIAFIPIHVGVAFFQSLEYTLSRTHPTVSTFSPIQRNKHSSQLAREKTSVAFSSLSKAFSPFPVSRHMLESLSSRKILYSMFKCLHPNRQHNSCKLTVVSNGTRIIQRVATDIVSLSKSRRLSAETVAV